MLPATSRLFLARDVALSVLVGMCAWGALALAQVPDVAYVPPFVLPSLEELATAWATGGVVVFLVVLFARMLLKRWLAPPEATEVSTLLNRLLALAVGLVCGFAIPGVQVAPGWGGKVLAGIVLASVGVFGRDVVTSASRGLKEVTDAS